MKALQGIATLAGNGTATDSGGRKFPFEIYAQTPDKRVLIRHQPGRDGPLGYNGNHGWSMDIAGDFRYMRSEKLDEYNLEDIVKLYFDTEPGLPVRILQRIDSAAGPYPTQVEIAEYHDAGGMQVPSRWTLGGMDTQCGPPFRSHRDY